MTLVCQIKAAAVEALKHLFPEASFTPAQITVNETKPEFKGDYTIVLFPLVKQLRVKPDELGARLGAYLLEKTDLFDSHQMVSGFLNLGVRDSFWPAFLLNHFNDIHFGEGPKRDCRVMVEYSSPNTNKPLHFGHLRNNFLGYAVSEVLKAGGKQVVKANLINDRGIHICKSMVAWQRLANGVTPESAGEKGDHFVGEYYVRFNDLLLEQAAPVLERMLGGDFSDLKEGDRQKAGGLKDALDALEAGAGEKREKLLGELKEIARNNTEITAAAKGMLQQWEGGDPDVKALWQQMNGWVYEGFARTYQRLGVDFDKMYYESDTYLLGKSIVSQGLAKGVLFRKEDGSVWVDLTADGLDQKLLLRADGTSVYMTQDLGTAVLKYNDYKLNQSVYVIADEQNYHMQVLKLILQKLGEPAAETVYHLSYGMVELPKGMGKMKSREGTAVDADDMVDEMVALAKEQTEEAGKTEGFTTEELQKLYEMIGLGALKFYLLRVDPKKKMVFNPKESIDLHGFTATFIQYAHARICSILRKQGVAQLPDRTHFQNFVLTQPIALAEKDLLVALEQYPSVIEAAAAEFNPSLLCNYAFHLAQLFNSFYDQHSIAAAENEEKKALRLMIIIMTAQLLRHSMHLMGIRLPEKM